ncbi:PepSY domain-containing protein [Gracilibacillus massiliensis]|uniref:PepSY domain-containing protein n=1 Tax=Gracilibacillus massiliensis TaxID=1564956 RepID=UPI0009E9B40D|nr:PepSY domain-containing protein [Gracilibacillus massiliensis]
MMKNKTFFIVLTVLVTIGGIFATLKFTSNSASAYLSKDEAQEKVSKQFSGEIVELELEEDNNKKVYEIEIEGTDRKYELKMDAETGDILKLEEKVMNNEESQLIDTTGGDSNNKKDNNEETTSKQSNDDTTKQSNSDSKTLITKEEAKSIALSEYEGTITEFELDEDDGQKYYEVEIRTPKAEVEIEINAYTGEIISISKDDLDDDDDD